MDSQSREDFYADLKGKFADTVAIYRHNTSADRIGVFDADLIAHLPSSVKWIAHNGAGYDQIDIDACKARGKANSTKCGSLRLTPSGQGSRCPTRLEQSTMVLRQRRSTSLSLPSANTPSRNDKRERGYGSAA